MAEAPHDALFERVEEALDAQQKAQVAALESAVPTLAEHLRAACENALRQDMGKAFMIGSGTEAVREALAALRAQLDEPAVDTEALQALETQVAALQEEKARIAEQHAHAQQ